MPSPWTAGTASSPWRPDKDKTAPEAFASGAGLFRLRKNPAADENYPLTNPPHRAYTVAKQMGKPMTKRSSPHGRLSESRGRWERGRRRRGEWTSEGAGERSDSSSRTGTPPVIRGARVYDARKRVGVRIRACQSGWYRRGLSFVPEQNCLGTKGFFVARFVSMKRRNAPCRPRKSPTVSI